MENSEIKQKAISGVFWQAIQRFGSRIILFIGNLFFARLLSPNDFGYMGMIWVFLSFSDIFINGGFASALIQKKNPSQDDYSTVFIWNIVLSTICYLTLYISAPYISTFYNAEIIIKLLRIQGLVLFFNALNVVQINRLQKLFRFKKLAAIDISSSVIGCTLGILAAYYGFGVWSLVVKMLSYSIISCFIVWIIEKWHPTIKFRWKSFKELFGFGSFMLLSSLTNAIFINFQSLIIGKMYAPKDLGYYTQARKLEEIPVVCMTNIISTVSFPLFSNIQDDKERLLKCLRKNIKSITFISFPLMFFFLIAAKPIIICLFTDKWIDSVIYFQLLCLSGLLIPINIANRDLYAAIGRSRLFFNSQLIYKTIGIALMLFGINFYGIIGLLVGKIIADYFLFVMNATISSRIIGYGIISQIKDICPNFFLSLLPSFILYVLLQNTILSDILQLIIGGFIFFVIYILSALITKNGQLFLCISIINNKTRFLTNRKNEKK